MVHPLSSDEELNLSGQDVDIPHFLSDLQAVDWASPTVVLQDPDIPHPTPNNPLPSSHPSSPQEHYLPPDPEIVQNAQHQSIILLRHTVRLSSR